MTDHATRRDTAVADVLDAIDAVTTPRCGTCDTILEPDGPSPWWCSEPCYQAYAVRASRSLAEPSEAVLDTRPPPTAQRGSHAAVGHPPLDPALMTYQERRYHVDLAVQRSSTERWPADRQMVEMTTGHGDGTGIPLLPADGEIREWVEAAVNVQLTPWQRHVLAVMSRIRRIRPGRTR
jgi:hypothetical protein